jgi:hypothetical protein
VDKTRQYPWSGNNFTVKVRFWTYDLLVVAMHSLVEMDGRKLSCVTVNVTKIELHVSFCTCSF